MEQTIKKIKENLPLIFMILGGILIIGATLTAIFGAGSAIGAVKVFYIILTVLMALLGCACIYFTTLITGAEDPNFFLYETNSKSNMPIEDLTFDHVNKKMTYFMSHLTKTAKDVWEKDIIGSQNEMFGEYDEFRALAAYKVIYDLGTRGNDVIWELYLSADENIVLSIADAIACAGDAELGKAIKYLHKNSAGNAEKTKHFLSDNSIYIQKKMLKYVKENIEKF